MELSTYEARFADAVERSFRDDAIRTAVLIDDQFPDYLSMRDAAEGEFTEIERARNIYAFMQGKGLICDVHNWRAPSNADLHLLDKARKSDLILLDYQLGAAGVKAALKILRHLAVSTHFNLVVLYTAEASPKTALTVATAMRGVKPAAGALVPSAELLENAEEVLADERFSTIDAAGLRAYLTDGKTPWVANLGQALNDAQIPPQNVKPLADHVARQWIAELMDDYELATDAELPVGCAIDADQPMWVHCGSCFVAIVPKLPASSTDDEGKYVWGRLGAALREWRPNIYRLILSEIQNALELEAVAHHENWLSDELALGLGLYLLESEEAARGTVSPSDVEGGAKPYRPLRRHHSAPSRYARAYFLNGDRPFGCKIVERSRPSACRRERPPHSRTRIGTCTSGSEGRLAQEGSAFGKRLHGFRRVSRWAHYNRYRALWSRRQLLALCISVLRSCSTRGGADPCSTNAPREDRHTA